MWFPGRLGLAENRIPIGIKSKNLREGRNMEAIPIIGVIVRIISH
jgi:hypothetical protein